MAKVTKQIGFTIEIDEEEVAPMSVNVFIYQMINRIGYEHTITSVTIDDATMAIESKEDLKEMSLKRNEDFTVDNEKIVSNVTKK